MNTKVSRIALDNSSPRLNSQAFDSTPKNALMTLGMILSESLAGVGKMTIFAYLNQCSSDTINLASITPRVQFHYSLSNVYVSPLLSLDRGSTNQPIPHCLSSQLLDWLAFFSPYFAICVFILLLFSIPLFVHSQIINHAAHPSPRLLSVIGLMPSFARRYFYVFTFNALHLL